MIFNILYNLEFIQSDKGLFKELSSIVHFLKQRGIDAQLITDTFNFNSYAIVTLTDNNGDSHKIFSFDLPEFKQKDNTAFFKILSELLDFKDEIVTIKLFGITSQNANSILNSIENNFNNVLFCVCYGVGHRTTIKIFSKKLQFCDLAITEVFTIFKRYIYAEDEVTLSERLIELLKMRGKHLRIAESLTGGAISNEIVDNAGVSEVFYEGIVVYSNSSKIDRLHVNPETILSYGAVSSQTAYEMSAGLISNSNDFVISTTGIAGPTGGSLSKPVGLTFISVGTPEAIHVYKHIFCGSRTEIRDDAVGAALFYSIRHLKNNGLIFDELIIE